MGYAHHKRGCIDCGHFRRLNDMVEKLYDVYFVDKTRRTLMRVGFCKECFEAGSFDLKKVKDSLAESERACVKEKGMSDALADMECCCFDEAEFVGFKSFKDFWAEYKGDVPVHAYAVSVIDKVVADAR